MNPVTGAAVRRDPLDAFFTPANVAVIGATEAESSVGRAVFENLTSFPGRVFPVNPKRCTVLGHAAFPSIAAAPAPVDLAVIVTPAATVPGLIHECAQAGVANAIVISSGFKECGTSGAQLEIEVLDAARRGGVRLVGPNCLGVISPHSGLNASFAASMPQAGTVAFISQSGALCTAILDWSLKETVGFSAFVSVGSMLDVGWGDLIDWLGHDPLTKSIVMYMESVGDARAFLSAARRVARTKPIIVIKVGHTEAAARAAASHTGALTGSDAVLDAAFRRAGVLRVATIEELFDMAEALAKQPRPPGPRLAIVTNAGGPGALATDSLVSSGGALAVPSIESLARLNALLPAHWSHGNPIDILGDASAGRFAQAFDILAEDVGTDGTLAILTPQAMTDATATASAFISARKPAGKPLLACWMGGAEVEAGRRLLNEAGIPTYDYPDAAARIFALMWRHSENLRMLHESPEPAQEPSGKDPDRTRASQVVNAPRPAGVTLLTKLECNQVLAAYGIPTLTTSIASSETAAVECARRLGGSVVLKLHSDTITHKSDVGGVKLDLRDEAAVRRAWGEIKAGVSERDFLGVIIEPMVATGEGIELIIGSSVDPQFGPVLLFGAGGQLVEVLRDRALGLPPLTAALARQMVGRTRIAAALRGVRGRAPVDPDALDQLLVRFSRLVLDHPRIKEIDINPLLASAGGPVALDARIVLFGPEVSDDALPQAALWPMRSSAER